MKKDLRVEDNKVYFKDTELFSYENEPKSAITNANIKGRVKIKRYEIALILSIINAILVLILIFK